MALTLIAAPAVAIFYATRRGRARMEIRGDDVYQDVWVDQAQIDRRETVLVPNPRGGEPLKLDLPRDAGHGWALRFAGKGLRGRGDLYVRLKVRRPDRHV